MQTVQTPRGTNTLLSDFRNEAELTELLGLVGAARMRSASVVAVAAPEAEPKPEPKPEPVAEPDSVPKSRNHIFMAYLQFERELSKLSAEQGQLQKLLFAKDWPTIVDSPSTQSIYRVAGQAITNLIQIARQRFAPAGVTLHISQCEVLEATGMSRWSEDHHQRSRRDGQSEAEPAPPVDLDKLWRYLENTYGGNAGIETAHRQNARFIIMELRLDGESEMRRNASSVS